MHGVFSYMKGRSTSRFIGFKKIRTQNIFFLAIQYYIIVRSWTRTMKAYLNLIMNFREIQPTLLWKKTKHWHHMESMLSALTLDVWCHGIQLRTSSSVPATDPNTITKEELWEGLLHWWVMHNLCLFTWLHQLSLFRRQFCHEWCTSLVKLLVIVTGSFCVFLSCTVESNVLKFYVVHFL